MHIILEPKTHLIDEINVKGERPRYRVTDDSNIVVSVERWEVARERLIEKL